MKISIITVVKNNCKTISETLESVLNQTYTDYEYIIIDGGSDDGTLDIIKKWSLKFDGKMKYYSSPDTGVYNAMNKGITLAEGDVIGLLHADDFYTDKNVLKSIADNMAEKWVDLVYGDICFVNNRDKTKVTRYYSARKFTPDKLRYGFAPPHPSLYCRKELYRRYGLYKENYIIAADFEMFVRFFRHSKVLSKYIPLNMVTMRKGGISTSWKHILSTNIKEKLRALRENNMRASVFLLVRKLIYV